MTLADVVHRIATDEDFAAQLRVEPQATLKASGLDLPAETLAALLKVLHWAAVDPAYASVISSHGQPQYASQFTSTVALPEGPADWMTFQFFPKRIQSFSSTIR